MFREGQQIGPYVLIRKLGTGGFGAVWLAEKRSQFLTKKVAVKLPHDEQVNFDAIKREAGLWEDASGHPNVLPIIDADVYDGQVVIVSEFADGGSLADKLKGVGTTSVKDAVEMTMGILSGLQFLHDRKIIHRDIKPQNVLLQGNTPRLADFGISRAMQTTAISSTIIGTDAYMSPEAFDGKRSVQTDIWSVGVVLYELLNGRLPFPQEHPSERMFAVLTKDFEPLPGDVPPVLRDVVQKALSKQPENRFASAAEMRTALENALVSITHPTLAKTEVYDRNSLATTVDETISDPEATVVRQQPIDTPVPFVSNPSVATQVARADQTGSQPMPAGNGQKQLIVIVGAFVGILLLTFSIVGLRAILSRNRASVVNVNVSNANANKAGYFYDNSNNAYSFTNVNSSSSSSNMSNRTNSTYSYNTNSQASNKYVMSGNQMVVTSAATFCEGYEFGWKDTFKKKKGEDYTPPPAPPCPDPSKYRDSLRDGPGGQIIGTIDAMGRISGKK